MFDECVTVGHACDEIGDKPGIFARALSRRLIAPLGRKRVHVFGTTAEEVGNHSFRIAHNVDDAFVPVHTREEECAKLIELCMHAVRETHHGMACVSHGIGARRPKRL